MSGGLGAYGGGNGGGNGLYISGLAYDGENAISGTGSGGGGSTVGSTSSGNKKGGNGGSGVVIIRYPNYTLNLPSALTCDILVIGGGGSGGGDIGGGGGAGGLIYKQNILLDPGTYSTSFS